MSSVAAGPVASRSANSSRLRGCPSSLVSHPISSEIDRTAGSSSSDMTRVTSWVTRREGVRINSVTAASAAVRVDVFSQVNELLILSN